MQAVQVKARGKVEFVKAPKPTLRPGHALVRTRLLSLCGSDIRMIYHSADHEYPFPPGTTGHEMVGVVEEIAPSTSDASMANAGHEDVRVGDVVLALAPYHEAMADYYSAPLKHVLPLPTGAPLEQLLQGQQLGTVLFACQRLPNLIGKSVAVIGQGSAGLFFNWQLRRMGAARVVALDFEPFRLEKSRLYGATETIHNPGDAPNAELVEAIRQANDGALADVVVEAAGEVAAINLAVDLVRPSGDILFFGVPRGQTIPFNFDAFFHKCLHAHAIVGASVEANQASTRLALGFIANRQIPIEPLLTHRLPFADVLDAYELHRQRGDRCLKIVIDMGEGEARELRREVGG